MDCVCFKENRLMFSLAQSAATEQPHLYFCFMDVRQPLCKVFYRVILKSEDASLLEVFSQYCQC